MCDDRETSRDAASVQPLGYAAIPVSVARAIGQDYRKDCVVILAYDHATSRTHATTWGREPSDKEGAVRVRDKCVEAIGGVMTPGTVYQDYRREGEAAKMIDALYLAIRIAVHGFRAELSDETQAPLETLAKIEMRVNELAEVLSVSPV